MSERPGEAEALAIVRSPKFNTDPAQRLVDEQLVRTVYPIIAAAVRADERAKVAHEAAAKIEEFLEHECAPPMWWRCYDIVHRLAGCEWVDDGGGDGLGCYDCETRLARDAGSAT